MDTDGETLDSIFPEVIGKIPTRDYGIDGLHVHVDHTPRGTVYFVSADKETPFPEHSHAEQWTIVVSGACRVTMNGETRVYRKGDTYRLPANVPHQITLGAGYAEVDYVDDPND